MLGTDHHETLVEYFRYHGSALLALGRPGDDMATRPATDGAPPIASDSGRYGGGWSPRRAAESSSSRPAQVGDAHRIVCGPRPGIGSKLGGTERAG